MTYLEIYISENCETCNRVVLFAEQFSKIYSNINLKIININQSEKSLSIVPAIFINQKLFCYGEFDKNKILEEISRKNKTI